jgi:hypothetical protein
MMRMSMSPSAAALLRALVARAAVARERILLTDARSTDWHSLTFTGERHHFSIKVTGADCAAVAARLCAGLEDAEFSIPGLLVADIAIVGEPRPSVDGAMDLIIEALTISSD